MLFGAPTVHVMKEPRAWHVRTWPSKLFGPVQLKSHACQHPLPDELLNVGWVWTAGVHPLAPSRANPPVYVRAERLPWWIQQTHQDKAA